MQTELLLSHLDTWVFFVWSLCCFLFCSGSKCQKLNVLILKPQKLIYWVSLFFWLNIILPEVTQIVLNFNEERFLWSTSIILYSFNRTIFPNLAATKPWYPNIPIGCQWQNLWFCMCHLWNKNCGAMLNHGLWFYGFSALSTMRMPCHWIYFIRNRQNQNMIVTFFMPKFYPVATVIFSNAFQ